MSRAVALLRSRPVPHAAALALISVAVAGCSADTSRFNENPFATAQTRAPETTASIHAAPVTRVESQPIQQTYAAPPASAPHQSAPYQTSYRQPAPYRAAQPVTSQPVSSQPVAGGGRGVASYQPPSAPIEATGSVTPPRSVAATSAGWSREGGTPIIVGTSDTLDIIARRYNVPTSAILQANRMSAPRQLQPGQQIIIPKRLASAPAAAPAPAQIASAPATRSSARTHTVGSGDTLMRLSRHYNVSLSSLARANNLTTTAMLQPGTRLNIPAGTQVAAAAPAPAPARTVEAPKPAPVEKQQVASIEPAQKANLASSAPANDPPVAEPVAKAAETTAALPSFRWPVRGRIITAYGAKTNGKQNDGINVAVPEGTPIKAAEDGVVAYAGNELKGYGNLVLIRHANGYVSAYSHASELSVKRGDAIKRGQVVGKAGQTGDVTSPQLHFEIRKGSTPVDPMQFLNGV